jgi:hypothetical protein
MQGRPKAKVGDDPVRPGFQVGIVKPWSFRQRSGVLNGQGLGVGPDNVGDDDPGFDLSASTNFSAFTFEFCRAGKSITTDLEIELLERRAGIAVDGRGRPRSAAAET